MGIQRHSAPAIGEGYKAFLIASQDPEEREYTDDAQQIEEVLVTVCAGSIMNTLLLRVADVEALADKIEHARQARS